MFQGAETISKRYKKGRQRRCGGAGLSELMGAREETAKDFAPLRDVPLATSWFVYGRKSGKGIDAPVVGGCREKTDQDNQFNVRALNPQRSKQ
jgi:hypothetical protein